MHAPTSQTDRGTGFNISVGRLALPFLLLISMTAAQLHAQTIPPRTAKSGSAEVKVNNTPAPTSHTERLEKEGLQIEFNLKALPAEKGKQEGLVAGANATATFRITDARSGQPITGLHPNAWLTARGAREAPSNEAACKDKIRTFMGGLLSVRADVDLNSYYLLTLNHDSTITFINPQVAFSRTKLESIVVLPGAGADWVLSKDKELLYVTLPEQSAVGVVNTVTRKLLTTIPLTPASKPMRITYSPDGRFIWVGLDAAPQVAVIDSTTNQLAAYVPTGAGLHLIAFSRDGRFAYVTNSSADTVSVIDAQTFKKISDIAVGKTPVPIASSSTANLIYVAAINGNSISVIDPARQRVVGSIPVKRGVVSLRFEPQGRYGFAVNQIENTVSVIDASTNSVVGVVEVAKGADQVAFTRRYAYIRATGSEKFSLIELSTIGRGKIGAVDVQAGQKAPSTLPGEIGVSDMIAPTPEGNAAIIANTPDTMLYYYVEGMMAPMGTYSNYKRHPRAVMVLDRSLTETAPGVYSAPLKLNTAGRFEVPFVIDQPRIVNCFQAEVADSPDNQKAKPAGASVVLQPLFKDASLKAEESASLRFKLSDKATGQPLDGLTDVQVLIFEPPGIWQERQWAKQVAPGTYEISQVFPRAGVYNVMIRISSRGIAFTDLPFTRLSVGEKTKPAGQGSN